MDRAHHFKGGSFSRHGLCPLTATHSLEHGSWREPYKLKSSFSFCSLPNHSYNSVVTISVWISYNNSCNFYRTLLIVNTNSTFRCSNLGVLSINVLPFFGRHIRNRLSEYFQKHYKMSLLTHLTFVYTDLLLRCCKITNNR